MSKHTCCGKIYRGYYFTTCGKTAKVERDGKWYCGTHDPVADLEKQKKRDAARNAELKASEKAQEEAYAKRKEQERRADCFPELLETLKLVSDLASQDWQESDGSRKGATDSLGRRMWFISQDVMNDVREAIAKATGTNPQ